MLGIEVFNDGKWLIKLEKDVCFFVERNGLVDSVLCMPIRLHRPPASKRL